MTHAPLFIQRRHGFSPRCLSPACNHFLKRDGAICRTDDGSNHRAAEVSLRHDPVGLMSVIGSDRPSRPAIRRQLAGAILQHITASVYPATDNHDSDVIALIVDASEDQVRIGRRVRLVFEERAEGWVVAQFTPIEPTEDR